MADAARPYQTSEGEDRGNDPRPLTREAETSAPMAPSIQAHRPVPHHTNGLDPYPQATTQKVVETYREVSWIASVLKQSWPYLMLAVSLIFGAGIAWQKLQASQDKIEVIAIKVDAHTQALGDIREGVAAIRAVMETEQKRAAQPAAYAPPPQIVAFSPPAPQLPAPAPSPKKRRAQPVQRSILCTAAGVGCGN